MNTKSIVFGTEVFSCVSLVEYDHCGWLQFFCLEGSSCCHSETERKVIQVEDAHWCVLRNAFCHPCYVGFYHVISIEIGHLSSAFDPDLVFAVLGKVVQTTNVESKFPTFGELADK